MRGRARVSPLLLPVVYKSALDLSDLKPGVSDAPLRGFEA
jgi:hypothetical protein